ncbi:MAG: hypothetical protein NW207_05585 [Cytophagales bacterium]|nr:hypothetical protein [Cytophagales bacterium]
MKQKLSKKWQLLNMDIAGQKVEGDQVKGFSLILESAGSYKLTGMETESGNWYLSNDSLILAKTGGKISNAYKMTALTDTKLILTGISETVPMTLVFVSNK